MKNAPQAFQIIALLKLKALIRVSFKFHHSFHLMNTDLLVIYKVTLDMKKEVCAFLSEHLANEPEWIYLIPGMCSFMNWNISINSIQALQNRIESKLLITCFLNQLFYG